VTAERLSIDDNEYSWRHGGLLDSYNKTIEYNGQTTIGTRADECNAGGEGTSDTRRDVMGR
jgi:hypothetical protein